MTLGVGEPQSYTPRHAAHEPVLNVEIHAEALDVGDQMVSRVGGKLGSGVAHRRGAASTSTLIELDDAICGRVEPATALGGAAAPRPTVQYDCRLPARVAAYLPIHTLPASDVEHAVLVWLDRWIQGHDSRHMSIRLGNAGLSRPQVRDGHAIRAHAALD